MHPFDDAPVVMGHRGAPHAAPENTPASFLAAWDAGATWVELDVRRSSDGIAVVHHDPETPDGVPVVARTAHDLANLGVWALEAVLADLPRGLGVDLEVKNLPGEPDFDAEEQTARLVAALLAGREDERRWMTSAFSPGTVTTLAEALPAIPAGQLHLSTMRPDAVAQYLAGSDVRVVCPQVGADGLDADGIAAVHERGFAVLVWTVDDVAEAERLAAAGADAICTNRPGEVARALGVASAAGES